MSDIWSGVGVDISQSADEEWLYRAGDQLCGPVPHQSIARKLANGELALDTLVAKEGGEFHPIVRVAAFSGAIAEAKKIERIRLAKKRRRIFLAIFLPVLIGAGVGGYFAFKLHKKAQAERVTKQLEAEAKLRQAEQAAGREVGLVALVSLGTEDTVKIRNQPPPEQPAAAPTKKATRPRAATGAGAADADKAAAPEPEQSISSCQLSQGDIFGTLKKNLGKINVCVEDEKSRDKQGNLPEALELSFVVQTSGKVVEFEIGDRFYRTGPLKNCMTKAFNSMSFPTSNGANCPVTIPIKIGK